MEHGGACLVLHHPLKARHVVAIVEQSGLGDFAVGLSHLEQNDVHPVFDAAVRRPHAAQEIHLFALGRHQRRHDEVAARSRLGELERRDVVVHLYDVLLQVRACKIAHTIATWNVQSIDQIGIF